MEKQTLAAVITGDIIRSTLLMQPEREKMLETLQAVMEEGKTTFPDWNAEIFQGDSFQASTSEIKGSLAFAVSCILRFREQGLGIRIALGIGEISFSSGSVRTSNGTAFLNSGRTLEELKKRRNNNLIGIKSGNEDADSEFEAHCASLDFLLARCTQPQAEALGLSIKGLTQVQIGEKLHITQPTVQQRLKASGWPVFKAILQRFASKY